MTRQQTNNNSINQPKRLSVQVTLSGLSFLIASQEGDVLFFTEERYGNNLTPEELLIQLRQCIKNQEALQSQFESVTVVYTTSNYSLVPTSLFDENKASEYLKFNTKILSNDYISYDEIHGLQAVVVYVPFVNINNFLFEQYGSFAYYHSSTLLTQKFVGLEKHTQGAKVYLHVLKDQVDCVVVNHGKLILCNSYGYKTAEDFLYYTLFAFEQLRLNPDSIPVILCGDIHSKSDLYEILYAYVRNVSFLENSFPAFASEESQEHYLLKSML